jgi:hypothetical protein
MEGSRKREGFETRRHEDAKARRFLFHAKHAKEQRREENLFLNFKDEAEQHI